MSVSLISVNKENIHHVLQLTMNYERDISAEDTDELENKLDSGWILKCIVAAERIVGFIMYGYNYDKCFYEIAKIIIDEKYRNQGIAKKSVLTVLNELWRADDCQEVIALIEPGNYAARMLFGEIGFSNTGDIIEGEVRYRLLKA